MKIVLATFGSLGDLHPALAIAVELKSRGHRPVIASFDVYSDAVAAAGIDFCTMRPHIAVFGDIGRTMEQLLDPRRGPEFLVRHMFMPHLRESYEDLDRAAADADLIVGHPVAYAAPLVAERRGLRWASTVLAPLSLMSAIDPPVFGGVEWLHAVRRLGVTPYRLVFRLARRIAKPWEAPLHELRRELGIPSDKLAQFEGQYSPHLNLALFSPLVAQPQPDWPAHTHVCGFTSYEGAPPEPGMQAELQAFLAAGDAPVVFGLGSSAVAIADGFWRAAIDAATRLGRRAILLTGRDRPPPPTPPGIVAFPYLPYSSVFPRASAVVHSCGIGTLAQALRAGRPQLIVPVAFDQPDNARRAARLGVARVLPFQRVTGKRLAQELARLLRDRQHEEAARCVSSRAAAENGAAAACDALERLAAR